MVYNCLSYLMTYLPGILSVRHTRTFCIPKRLYGNLELFARRTIIAGGEELCMHTESINIYRIPLSYEYISASSFLTVNLSGACHYFIDNTFTVLFINKNR